MSSMLLPSTWAPTASVASSVAVPAKLPTEYQTANSLTIDMQHLVEADARPALMLPPLSMAQATISPPNTHRYPPVLAPLRVLPDYCRFPGCPNFGKMQGYCHDHIHGRPTSLPGLAMPPVVSRPMGAPQLLPGLHSVVPPEFASCSSVMSSPASSVSSCASYQSMPSAVTPASVVYPPAPTLKRPPPVMIPLPNHPHNSLKKRPRVFVDVENRPVLNSAPKSRPAKCRRENCRNDARRKGLCMEHGGRHFCKMEGCTKCAHRGGFCISHGGGRRCAVANCTKSAQSGGICYSHGGGKRCATDGCSHAARSGGFCIKHGKQQRERQMSE